MSKRVAGKATVEPVVFRVYPDGEVIALFPAQETSAGNYCIGDYTHVGQHGEADYQGVISQTRPAKLGEYRELAKELRGIGYRLKILKRTSRCHFWYAKAKCPACGMSTTNCICQRVEE